MEKIVTTACSTCYCGCGVLAHVEDGTALIIKGDPEHPYSQGALCPRGYSALELLYHPNRLNYPMQRVGERGEGKWQRISWDEALSTIANKLNKTKEQYGPEANSISAGAWMYGNTGITAHFGSLIGTPNWVNLTHICFGPMATATSVTIGYYAGINITETVSDEVLASSCILLWGANPRASAPYPVGEGIFDVKEKGTKLIVVDPRLTDYAKEADIWLQIRPGTDDALALGMINVIINENLYDKKFVDEWCFGFEELKDRVNEYPPEKVSKITWIPESDIEKAARMFAITKPSCLCQRVSLDQSYNSVQSSRATLILTAICG
ncbi:molybdopterin-dependent oxidoreductase, partial [Chloroflexota bacterium]